MTTSKTNAGAPTMDPPAAETDMTEFGGPAAAPSELPLQEAEMMDDAAPTTVPPTETEIEAAEQVGIAAWHTGKKITALWSNDHPRNCYVAVSGMGWKKLSNANNCALVNLTMLAANAEQMHATVKLHIGTDGMIDEIYVW